MKQKIDDSAAQLAATTLELRAVTGMHADEAGPAAVLAEFQLARAHLSAADAAQEMRMAAAARKISVVQKAEAAKRIRQLDEAIRKGEEAVKLRQAATARAEAAKAFVRRAAEGRAGGGGIITM